jgi:hypothetical protein
MRGQTSDIGRRRVGQFSGAQSGSAVRSGGELPETVPTAVVKHHLKAHWRKICGRRSQI